MPRLLPTAAVLALIAGCVPPPMTALVFPWQHPPANVLIVTDTAANVGKIAEIVKRLDEELGPDEVHVIRLRYADASNVAAILNHVFVGARLARPVIVADRRTNSLVIRARRSEREAIGRLLGHD